MKLLYIVQEYGIQSETFVTDLIEALSKHGDVHLTVAANRVSGAMRPFLRHVPFVESVPLPVRLAARLKYGPSGEARTIWEWDRRSRRGAEMLLQSVRPSDFEAAYLDFGATAVRVQEALIREKLPYFVHFHGADISSGLSDPGYRRGLERCFEHASGIFCASDHIRRLLILEGASSERIHKVGFTLPELAIQPMDWSSREQEGPGIGFVGRLTAKKHPIALVQAFSLVAQEIPQARLTIVGDGPLRGEVLKRISNLGLSGRVELRGALPRQDAMEIMNRQWVAAQHSVTSVEGDQEGFAISLLESAGLGLPVVSTLHNGITENVVDGETGYLVQEHDFEAMADRIVELLRNAELRERMGVAGLRRALQAGTMKERMDRILQVISP